MAPMPNARRHPRARRLLALLAAGGLAVAMAAACGGGGDDDEAGTDPTTSDEATTTPSTTAPVTPEDEAKAVYLEFVEVVERLLTTDASPDDPELLRLAVDPVLSSIRDGTQMQRAENQLWQLGDRTSHRVGEASHTAEGMLLRDCLVENDVLIDQDDGRIVQATPLTTRDLEVTMVQTPAGWAVADIATITKTEGEVPCDS